MSDCKLYSPQGALISEVKPQGNIPILEACDVPPDISARAYFAVISQSEGNEQPPAPLYPPSKERQGGC